MPFVAKESCFALKGGTAINLFIRDLPRLSVDIDLTYLPFDKRTDTFKNNALSLNRIKSVIEQAIPGSIVNEIAQSNGAVAKTPIDLCQQL